MPSKEYRHARRPQDACARCHQRFIEPLLISTAKLQRLCEECLFTDEGSPFQG